MAQGLAKREGGISPDVLAQVMLGGDLSRLDAAAKVSYYQAVCESVGLNPLTQPFDYLRLNGKEVLYAKRACTDQLRSVHGVSVQIIERKTEHGIHSVQARASVDGRTDESVGAVCIDGLKGENLANAIMKAETKAKRRVTLSICGLSVLDESELDGVKPNASPRPALRASQAAVRTVIGSQPDRIVAALSTPKAPDPDVTADGEVVVEPDPWGVSGAVERTAPTEPWSIAELEAAGASDVALSDLIFSHGAWLATLRGTDGAAAAWSQLAPIAKALRWDGDAVKAEIAAAIEKAGT